MLNKATISKHIIPLSPIPTNVPPEGKLHGKIGVVLFDIYGTLFISGSGDIGIAKSISHKTPEIENLLKKYGITGRPDTILDFFF